jgi:hypothetical protein
VRTHKTNIGKKKLEIRMREKSNNYSHPAELRYGMISALGKVGPLRRQLPMRLLMLPSSPVDRLLSCVQFMFDWISFVSRRSQFTASFATRLRWLGA